MYLTKTFWNREAWTDVLVEGQFSALNLWLSERSREGWVLDRVVAMDGAHGLLVILVSDPTLSVTAFHKLCRKYPALSGGTAATPAPVPYPPAPA